MADRAAAWRGLFAGEGFLLAATGEREIMEIDLEAVRDGMEDDSGAWGVFAGAIRQVALQNPKTMLSFPTVFHAVHVFSLN